MKLAIDYKDEIKNLSHTPLKYVFENNLVNNNGLYLEFGVYSGNTINIISKFTNNNIYGFDSFEGLPEDWRDNYLKGKFNLNGNLPIVNENVVLIKGWFNESLSEFMKKHKEEKITFIHIDCDIYSSTKTIFDLTKNNISNNCIIVFDELINYPNYFNHEWKAWWEFVKENNIEFEWIGMNGFIQEENNLIDRGFDQQVAVKILNNPSYSLN